MATATVTSKGQTTIPKGIREYLHLHPGDQIDYVIGDDGSVTIHPTTTDIMELKGILKTRVKRVVSLEEMDEAIRAAALGKTK